MNNEILYVLLPDFAEHEMVYLAQAIASDEYALKENPKYVNKVAAPTMESIKSIGGFRMLPDYSFDTMPEDYAALVLIGGFGWVTANGSATLEFAKELLLLLQNDTPERIEMYYQFNKQGFCELFK